MNGLYNILFGVNPASGMLLTMLGVDFKKVPRFRDCFVNEKDEIVIFTRCGGSNREDYAEQLQFLRGITGYLGDHDDDFDYTYAHFRYKFPEEDEWKGYLEILKKQDLVVDMAKRWETLSEIAGRMSGDAKSD